MPILLTGNTQNGGGGGYVYEIETFIITAAQELSDTVQLVSTIPPSSEFVYVNGIQLLEGVSNDYCYSGSPTLLTFCPDILHENDILIIKYSP